ncbi:MAG: flavodoxin [Erysipelotrichaceae bacterium]
MKKVLVTYFSHSGNTKVVAEKISSVLNGDLFEIKTLDTYQVKYNLVVDQAKKEFLAQYRPKLQNHVENLNNYDVIVIGYPMWWYTCPMAIFSFLEEYDFSGKVILPFCTHEGSALSSSIEDIKKIVPTAIVKEGLAIRGSKVSESDQLINAWLKKVL